MSNLQILDVHIRVVSEICRAFVNPVWSQFQLIKLNQREVASHICGSLSAPFICQGKPVPKHCILYRWYRLSLVSWAIKTAVPSWAANRKSFEEWSIRRNFKHPNPTSKSLNHKELATLYGAWMVIHIEARYRLLSSPTPVQNWRNEAHGPETAKVKAAERSGAVSIRLFLGRSSDYTSMFQPKINKEDPKLTTCACMKND